MKIVATNGCFDVLHKGHVEYLQESKNSGDFLVVGINSDASVRALKGEGRPVNKVIDRMTVLAGLEAVDCVVEFKGHNACQFIETCRPDVYTKGGDYSMKSLNQSELSLLRDFGAQILILKKAENVSSSMILESTNTPLSSK